MPDPMHTPAGTADRNLLFGILALQMDFIGRDGLIRAMNAWVLDKHKPLSQILVEQGALAPEARALLEPLVHKHLQLHGDDPQKSLAAIGSVTSVQEALLQVSDPDIQASLQGLTHSRADDAYATRDYSAGLPSSSGRRFRILRPHARGGLGEVFVAHDDELHRQVALKQIQDRHADDAGSRARFLLEAEVTGGLEHPGIVPVYGLGTYADGRPFYAMRFIKGDSLQEAIAQYHRMAGARMEPGERTLALRKLLGRFLDVCNAIQYAHDRGVLHRDLKPGNIMLGPYGETLVVDWGLAKATGKPEEVRSEEAPLRPASASGSAETLPGATVGTPQYMSPEQAEGRLDRLGPASDVYSLGATLYALLTGRAPFPSILDEQHPRPDARPLPDVLRLVRQGDFPSPRQVNMDVDKALEAICLKAMKLRPEDRYTSARALSEDVEHWLADEPVRAYPEPWVRRARRWLARHRTLVTSAAALLVTAVAALVLGLVAVNIERQRTAAANLQLVAEQARTQEALQKEAAQRRQTRAALDDMLSQDSEAFLTTQKQLLPAQQAFLDRARAYYQEFATAFATDEEGRSLVGRAQFRLGHINQTLARWQEAEVAYRAAIRVFEQLASDFPATPTYRAELAQAQSHFGTLLADSGRWEEAVAVDRAGLAVLAKLVADDPAAPLYRRSLGKGNRNLGNRLVDLGQHAEAERAYRAALALFDRLTADDMAVDDRHIVAMCHRNLGALLFALGKFTEADAEYQAAVALQEKIAAESPAAPDYRRELAASRQELGVLYAELGRREDAYLMLMAAQAIRTKLTTDYPLVQEYHQESSQGLSAFANMLEMSGVYGQVVELLQKGVLENREKLLAENPRAIQARRDLAESLAIQGNSLTSIGKPVEGEVAHRRALALFEKLAADFPRWPQCRRHLAMSRHDLALTLANRGRHPEAAELHRAAMPVLERLVAEFPAVHRYRSDLALNHANLGLRLRSLGKRVEAAAEYQTARAMYERLAADYPAVPRYPRQLAVTHFYLGNALADLGRPVESDGAYRAGFTIFEKLAAAVPSYNVELGGWYSDFGNHVRDHGNAAQALDWYAKAIATLGPPSRTTPQSVVAKLIDQSATPLPPAETAKATFAMMDAQRARIYLRNAQWRRAMALTTLRRPEEAVRDWDRALELDDGSSRYVLRVGRSLTHAHSGQVAKATAEANEVADAPNVAGFVLYDCACVFALAASTSDDHAARAVVLLRQAITKGYRNIPHVLKDPDLDALRRRPDYADLLWDLADLPEPPQGGK